jgi:2-phosphosulfolactate phosphatase
VRVHVAFTPAEDGSAPVGVVVDVVRATSTITQALPAGNERVLCFGEIHDALAHHVRIPDSVTAGERLGVKVAEFDYGVSPQDYRRAGAKTLILSTTNGTTAILEAAARCGSVILGALLNLDALVRTLRERGEDVIIMCAGFQRAFALDDAYCAGRIVQALAAERSDAAIAAELVAQSFPDAWTGLTARTYGPPGLDDDIRYCAQESVLDVVPRFAGMDGPAAVIRA